MEEKKKSKFFEKVILGFVIGSAVVGAVGAGLNSEKGKHLKEGISKRLKETSGKINSVYSNCGNEEKKGFWFFLNKLFFKK